MYSGLSTRATVRLAPRFFARMLAVMLVLSNGVTAMKRSASVVPASRNIFRLVGFPTMVSRSQSEPMLASRSSLSSMSVISSLLRDRSLARCVPMAYAPAMMIFILL